MITPNAMQPLRGNAIKPTGWLRRQLMLQANGLAGNLDKMWPDVRDSRWIGGDREGWERVPYWLDGFIPLAYLLDDEDLKARAKRYIDAILDQQCEDGWICPCSQDERANYDTWATLLITKVLVLYADCSGDERIEEALYRCLKQFNRHLDGHTLRVWGAARWFEGLIAIAWLYERRPEPWLIDLAQKLHFQGFDWNAIFDGFVQREPESKWTLQTHVVNLAMCLKQEALYGRFFPKKQGDFTKRALEMLNRHHGQAHGHFSGDECLAGTSPIRGTELCGVVEAMYSCEQLLAITGDAFWGDHLEKLAFNALPATCSADMWTHQYDQQVNQIRCARLGEGVFGTNSIESNRFGLEPNFGCCTANMGQGWPKLAASAVMEKDGGATVCALVPVQADLIIQGVKVRISVEGDYPFRDELSVKVQAEKPVSFPLFIRIPGYVTSAQVDGQSVKTGAFACVEKDWTEETVHVSLKPEQTLVQRPSGMQCLWRGALLFALPIAEEWVREERPEADPPRIFPYCDYDILPKENWGYAFAADAGEVRFHDVPDMPFDTTHPAVEINLPMRPIEWQEESGTAKALPESLEPTGPAQMKTFIPYGATQLRMTEMPKV